MSLIDLARKFIEIESTNKSGNLILVDFISRLAKDWGLFVEVQEERLEGVACGNIIIRPQAQPGKKELLLLSHLDTHDPGIFHEWEKTGGNPYSGSIHGDRLYGLGACGAKLDFLCKLMAVKELSDRPYTNRSYVLVGTYGYSKGMVGAMKVIRHKKVNADCGLIGGSTGLQLCHESPGFAVLEVVIPFSKKEMEYHRKHDQMESSYTQSKIFTSSKGLSQREATKSAIQKVLDYIEMLPEGIAVMELEGGVNASSFPTNAVLEVDIVDEFNDSVISKLKKIIAAIANFEKEFEKYPCEGFEPTCSSMNIGRVKTNTDSISMSGVCRLVPSITREVYEKWIEMLKSECEAVGAQMRVIDYKQPFHLDVTSPFAKKCSEVGVANGLLKELKKYPTSTEASLFSRVGVECLVFGPGKIEDKIIASEESIRMESLTEAISFYKNIIGETCR